MYDKVTLCHFLWYIIEISIQTYWYELNILKKYDIIKGDDKLSQNRCDRCGRPIGTRTPNTAGVVRKS